MLFLFLCVLPLTVEDTPFVKALIEHYDAKKPLAMNFSGSLDEAVQARHQFSAHLAKTYGAAAGYKVAIVGKKAQKRFRSDGPIYGNLYAGMLHADGSKLPLKIGAYSLLEGDLMVRVGDEAINDATSPMEVLAALDAVLPFLETPDLVFAPGSNLDAAAITAINAGTRGGVMGKPVPLKADAETLAQLDRITVELKDGKGQQLAYGSADNLTEHPLDAVLWLRTSLRSKGLKLKKGDLISLGTMTNMLPVKEAGTVTAQYRGLPGLAAQTLTVQFGD